MGARLPEELLPPRVVVSGACPSASGLYIAESDLATGLMRVIDRAGFVLAWTELWDPGGNLADLRGICQVRKVLR